MRPIADAEYKQQILLAILHDLGKKVGIVINVENAADDKVDKLASMRLDFHVKNRTYKDAMDELMETTKAFTWQRDDDSVNIVAVAIAAANPFDRKIEPLKFKGTRSEFLQLMNETVADLEATQLSVAPNGDARAIITVETKERMTLRQVFNRFTKVAGVHWRAQVGDQQPATSGPAVRVGNDIRGVRVSERTTIMFIPD